MVRHALLDKGCGKLALPGGYEMLGPAWQEPGLRRCWKTQALWPVLPPVGSWRENYPGSKAESALLPKPASEHEGAFVHDAEVLVIYEPVETGFPLHIRIVS
jgi:hypothetical protein